MISADRNSGNNVPTEASPDLNNNPHNPNPISNENIDNLNSPSFQIEEPNENREFNLNLLSETIKCEEIITNSTAILIHFLILSLVFYFFLRFEMESYILYGTIVTIEILSLIYSVFRARKTKISFMYLSSFFLEFVNLILMTVSFIKNF